MYMIARDGFLFFNYNQDSIIPLKIDLEEPIVTDVLFANWFEDCPKGYIEMKTTAIPGNNAGCACDWNILPFKNCTNSKINPKAVSCNIVEKPNNFNPNCGAKCCNCYNNIIDDISPRTFTVYYDQKKICYYKDPTLNTDNYLKSLTADCDQANTCNFYFCKLNNDYKNQCPLTNSVINTIETNYLTTNSTFDQPVIFSNSSQAIKDYDNKGYPKILLPFVDIFIGNTFMCDDSKDFTSNYPLINPDICLSSIKFNTVDSVTLQNLVEINNYQEYYDSQLPLWKTYFNKDNILLQTKHALNPFTVNCIIQKTELYMFNAFKNIPSPDAALNRANLQKSLSGINQYTDVYYFIEKTINNLYILQAIIIFLSVCAVSIKLFNCFYDFVKPILFFYNYENFLSLFIDFIVLIIAGNSTIKLQYYMDNFDILIQNDQMIDCLGEYGKAMIMNLQVICDTIEGTHKNLALVAAIRFIMIFFSMFHYLISTKVAKYKTVAIITILLEKENPEEGGDEEDEEEEEDDEEEEEEDEENKELYDKKEVNEKDKSKEK